MSSSRPHGVLVFFSEIELEIPALFALRFARCVCCVKPAFMSWTSPVAVAQCVPVSLLRAGVVDMDGHPAPPSPSPSRHDPAAVYEAERVCGRGANESVETAATERAQYGGPLPGTGFGTAFSPSYGIGGSLSSAAVHPPALPMPHYGSGDPGSLGTATSPPPTGPPTPGPSLPSSVSIAASNAGALGF
jgi:hypothetical protein